MNDNLLKDRTPIEQIADLLLEAHAIARTSDYRVLQTTIEIALLETGHLIAEKEKASQPTIAPRDHYPNIG